MASPRVATVMASRVDPQTGEWFEVDVAVDPPPQEEDSDTDDGDASSSTCAVCGDHHRELIAMLTRNAEGEPDWWSGVYICRPCDYARSDATEAALAAQEAARVRIRRFVLYARAVGWFVCRYKAAQVRVGTGAQEVVAEFAAEFAAGVGAAIAGTTGDVGSLQRRQSKRQPKRQRTE